MATIKPTLKDPISPQSKKFEKDFKKTMVKNQVTIREGEDLNEVDGLLSEVEQSLKKKIFSLQKMEALVFSDPKLSAVYEDMAENGEEKYGYHSNETIQNMIFNDYVLNSPQYLQKYKMAIPKEKKRRDKSGINTLKKAGQKQMAQSGLGKQTNESINEGSSSSSGGGNGGAFESPIGFKDDVKNVSKELDTEAELKDLDIIRVSLPGQEKRAYGVHKSSGPNVSSAIAKPIPNKAVRKPYYPGGEITSPFLKGLIKVTQLKEPKNQTELNENINMNNTAPIKVVFLINEKNNDLFAYFPEEKHNDEFATAYSQLGQHSAIHPDYAKESRPATPEEYQALKIELEEMGYNLEILNGMQESTSAGSAGGGAGYVGYAGPAAFSSKGDLSGDFKGKNKKKNIDPKAKPISKITALQETNYLTDPSGFEKYAETLNEELLQEKAKSKSQQRFMGMVNAYKNGELDSDEVTADIERAADSMTDTEVDDFASTKHKGLPEKVKENNIKEDTQTMIQNNGSSMSNKAQATGDVSNDTPVGTQQTGGLNEADTTLLEELNNELEAFSIHQDKLKLMSEDRKTTSQILNKRVNDENPKNFKKDLQHSGVKQVLDVEKELEWKDQQTDIKDPQKLGADIEKKAIKSGDMKSDEALKNVGNNSNDDGDKVTKRNLTTKEQEEVNLYRNGLHSPVFDNEPDQRFEDRMKADMGEEIYDQRQKQIAFKGKAPMYNKDLQPIEDTTADKVQFDKEQTGWNERMGIDNEKSLKESFVTGSFHNDIGKRHLIDFKLNEVSEINEEASKELFKLDFTGLGNSYHSKTVDNKVIVNEAVVNVMNSHKFFTNGKEVFAMENPKQSINENETKEKPVVNEAQKKMKHLLGYDTKSYVNTKNIKL